MSIILRIPLRPRALIDARASLRMLVGRCRLENPSSAVGRRAAPRGWPSATMS